MNFKIGIDGGGTKTEGILIDESGTVVAIHVGAGCNPSVIGQDQARSVVSAALESLRAQASAHPAGITRAPFSPEATVDATLLCMAGSRTFWESFAADLKGFGRVVAVDDSLPVLELATRGKPGLVLHAGTGSFVAARGADGSVHYAGGLGWRFNDSGSGYDLGQRAVTAALLDLQGWVAAPGLRALVCQHTSQSDLAANLNFFYNDAAPNQKIAALAPAVLRLAGEGDAAAKRLVIESAGELFQLASAVATKLFPDTPLGSVRAGLSGPILTHPLILQELAARSPLSLAPVEGTPIEGVRRLLHGPT
jgi:glucosamine kinase